MTQELSVASEAGQMAFAGRHELSPAANVGAIAIEQERAIAETQGKLILAKRFPRSVAASTKEFLDSCKSPAFAEAAFYAVPNRGTGPSIRFAEEAARCYGNFDYGHRELSRGDGKSEVEVYAWDMEKNNYSRRQITILHQVDTRNGPKTLTDQADIDNRIANIASKQVRGRILALVPKALVEAGKAEAKKTLAGSNDLPISERIIQMTTAFGRFGVTPEVLEAYLDHRLDNTTSDELVDLRGIFNAILEGAKPSEFFGAKEEQSDAALAIANANKDGKAAPAKTEPKATAKETAKPPAEEKPKAETKAAEKETKAEEPAAQAQATPTEAAPTEADDQAAGPAQEPQSEPETAAAETPPGQAESLF